ncbi:MAG: acyl-ACP desaturase [Candidatus Hydrogenedentes bacterium]|nr:acyl-ACP desaturase [Candidatus Hydrogenedentota bacterium]
MHPGRIETLRHLDQFVADNLSTLLRDPEVNWQPTDYTPDLSTESGFEALRSLREEARMLSEDVLTVLVGDMITEEALPTYASWISVLEGVQTKSHPETPWGQWNRAWCGEENRHGDLLNRWLYLSGRVNMREVEVTTQSLIHDGGDTQTENDPYRGFVYTSFQEIATRVSHLNVGRLARQAGAEGLYKICSKIAGDEQRHARAYKLFFQKFLELDTNEALLAFQDMMKKKITMPAMYMRERGKEKGESFARFEEIATRTGIYTSRDYIEILENLIGDWNIAHLQGLSPAAESAQQFLCGLPGRYMKILDRMAARTKKSDEEAGPNYRFSWILEQGNPFPLPAL